MMSGTGGCEPFGLGSPPTKTGCRPRSSSPSTARCSCSRCAARRSAASWNWRRSISAPARNNTAFPVNYRSFSIDDIRAALAAGKLVVVLISGFLMFGKKVPHWVLAIGDDGDHILMHDPWIEDERRETISDAANVPVPYDIFMQMAQFGRDGLRAAIILGKRRSDNDLGHPHRPPERSRPGRDAAQDHHQPRLSRPSGAVSRPAAEGHQPVQQLRLPEPRLLRLAARQFARPQGHPDASRR